MQTDQMKAPRSTFTACDISVPVPFRNESCLQGKHHCIQEKPKPQPLCTSSQAYSHFPNCCAQFLLVVWLVNMFVCGRWRPTAGALRSLFPLGDWVSCWPETQQMLEGQVARDPPACVCPVDELQAYANMPRLFFQYVFWDGVRALCLQVAKLSSSHLSLCIQWFRKHKLLSCEINL